MGLTKADPEFRRLLDVVVDELKRHAYRLPERNVDCATLADEGVEQVRLQEIAEEVVELVYGREVRETNQLGMAPWMCRDCN